MTLRGGEGGGGIPNLISCRPLILHTCDATVEPTTPPKNTLKAEKRPTHEAMFWSTELRLKHVPLACKKEKQYRGVSMCTD